jgi:hypothetical protein
VCCRGVRGTIPDSIGSLTALGYVGAELWAQVTALFVFLHSCASATVPIIFPAPQPSPSTLPPQPCPPSLSIYVYIFLSSFYFSPSPPPHTHSLFLARSLFYPPHPLFFFFFSDATAVNPLQTIGFA